MVTVANDRICQAGWSEDSRSVFEANGRTKEEQEAYAFVKKLTNWRKNAKAIHQGKMTHFIPENDVYVFFRYLENESVMIVLNKNTKDQTLDLSRFSERIGNTRSGTEVITGNKLSFDGTLTVTARSSMIIELD